MNDIEKALGFDDISPFTVSVFDDPAEGYACSLTLDCDGEYCADIFAQREDEDFEGNGYDWESIATVYLNEKAPELIPYAEFDSEAGMFCVYFSGKENVDRFKAFVNGFINAVRDKNVLSDLFSRAEII